MILPSGFAVRKAATSNTSEKKNNEQNGLPLWLFGCTGLCLFVGSQTLIMRKILQKDYSRVPESELLSAILHILKVIVQVQAFTFF